VTKSFHGRDIFAPVAAHVAGGVPLEDLGPEIPVGDLVRLRIPTPVVRDGELVSAVVYVDGFGNVKLAGGPDHLFAALGPLVGGTLLAVELTDRRGAARTEVVPWEETFGVVPVGALLLYEDSLGRLCLAENQGDAGRRLGLGDDLPVAIRRA
jgi:hypothetical protein